YAQKKPKKDYKREAFDMFGRMLEEVKHDIISLLARVRIQSEEELAEMDAQRRRAEAMHFKHAKVPTLGAEQQSAGARKAAEKISTFVRTDRKIGRNEACPCGSGKKYKQCHGKLT
ncbi:MAG: SEC-C domain-containing protein, partial [Proteobacteria bacterium]|nr:SEC-C domain-containing protein [Pseudomonadota bacterium]